MQRILKHLARYAQLVASVHLMPRQLLHVLMGLSHYKERRNVQSVRWATNVRR